MGVRKRPTPVYHSDPLGIRLRRGANSAPNTLSNARMRRSAIAAAGASRVRATTPTGGDRLTYSARVAGWRPETPKSAPERRCPASTGTPRDARSSSATPRASCPPQRRSPPQRPRRPVRRHPGPRPAPAPARWRACRRNGSASGLRRDRRTSSWSRPRRTRSTPTRRSLLSLIHI